MEYHKAVLLKESIKGLNIKADGTYVDATFGGGGHSREILRSLDNGILVGFDQDEAAWQNRIIDDRFIMIKQNFRHLKRFLKLNNITVVDGIIADLGISSHQIDTPQRGFSTRFEGPLDMRMNKSQPFTAQQLITSYSEKDLVRIFSEYGEIKNSKKLASFISRQRKINPVKSTQQLVEIAKEVAIGNLNKYLSQLFQAIRIEVNDEINALIEFLKQSIEILREGGRLVVISYHSLEDRIVKNMTRWGDPWSEAEKDVFGNVTVPLKAVNKKPIIPSEVEILANPRSRSAKLRIAERI